MKTKTKTGTINDEDGEYTGEYFVNNVCPDGKMVEKIIKSGKGTMKYKNGDVYDGRWMENIKNGKGTMKYANGDVYIGAWSNSQHGRGIMRYANGDIYEGDWFVNHEDGDDGITRYANGDVYTGQVISLSSVDKSKGVLRSIRERPNGYPVYDDGKCRYNGKIMNVKRKPGKGTMAYANGDVYTGEWINNVRDGFGTMSYVNGDIYVGKWEKNVRHGYGKMSYANGNFYEGEWFNNAKKRKKHFSKRKKSSNSKTKSKKDKINK